MHECVASSPDRTPAGSLIGMRLSAVRMSTILAGLLLLVTLCLHIVNRGEAAMTGADGRGSVNVQDYGASGSDYQTVATTVAGERSITVTGTGDFRPGQEVIIDGAYVQYQHRFIYGPGSPYDDARPLRDEVEIRGYTGATGSWIVYILDIDGLDPLTFRWSDDLARTWKGTKIPVTFDWQPLSGGTEVRFRKRDWVAGNMISFSARDHLITSIEAVRGNVITLRDAPNRTTEKALVSHSDTSAVQAAIDSAIKEKRNVFFPTGTYRLTRGILVRDAAAIRIEGAGGETTIVDISDGTGSCLSLDGGTEVTIRNFRMVGHTGVTEGAGAFATSSGHSFWASALKPCNAVSIHGTERVLIENVHASKMASECFYSQGPEREGTKVPKSYTKELTYLHCSVTDCAANAFNNNDMAENTSILYCRIENAAMNVWHAWEGPARYIRLIGNYVHNAGPFTIGDKSSRPAHLHELGCGQAVVSGNVFEGGGLAEGIEVVHGPTQVVISGNLFINYNGPAIRVSGETARAQFSQSFPARNVTVTGNIIDMTSDPRNSGWRTGIRVGGASDVTVSDNQIYLRGSYDPHVVGITIDEPSTNVTVHDNLIEDCAYGIWARRATSEVTKVIDARTFLEDSLPLEWRTSHLYRGWKVIWLSGDTVKGVSVIDSFDPESLCFRLKEPRDLHVGDQFEIAPPGGANWNLHDNTITGCLNPAVLDAYGSSTSTFARNTISRGGAIGVRQALDIRGRFNVIGNLFSDFDETGSVVLALHPDRFGKALPNVIGDNIFENCSGPVAESQKGLWNACSVSGNLFAGRRGGVAPSVISGSQGAP